MTRAWRDNLVARHPRVLAFGVLCGALSGFGQTFFVSLFVPTMGPAFGLDKAGFGAVYGAATVASAIALPVLGSFVDRVPLKAFAIASAAVVAAACAALASASHVFVLGLGLWLARLGGQGLLSHTWSTSMARYFERDRGKAIGIASLGHPLGEAIWPSVFVWLIASYGWRASWWAAACVALIAYPVVTLLLLAGKDTHPREFRGHDQATPAATVSSEPERSWTRGEVLRSPAVWLMGPQFLLPAFVLTGFFFQQLALADEKGWSAAWIASSFMAFALGRGAFSFLGGALIDKIGAARLLPVTLAPLGLGLLALGVLDGAWVAPAYLALAGVSMGVASSTNSSFLAERFGVEHFGSIRSALVSLAVLSTAAAPPVFGVLLERGVSFAALAQVCAACVLISAALTFVGVARLRRESVRRAAVTPNRPRQR